ncbi:NAD(P)-dependent oxidoreductase [Flavobacterium sp. ASW18X]|uniref:NAD(P)-dependent oxidoreductase n=1 Tax=Flavobacterium sp. ASW18X TaxID=2572595 RepID=UPI0010AE87CF|nr:NAD(P)-dependent oxidoreductase [Flavobacterium sp. ASW18X]TKD66151.1 3-phosphoglycerate dehydrogenase [Flavobacterium sp. ASW18X]
MILLANDGLAQKGKEKLEAAGFTVKVVHVAPEQIVNYINEHKVEGILVRSNTELSKEVLQKCPNLKLIGRLGVGLDKIDVAFAESKKIKVINTPKASANAVAELVFAHLLSGARFLYDANRNMPLEGDSRFLALKKDYAKGSELKGKTLGIIGLGHTGTAVAKKALGLGMRVAFYDRKIKEKSIELSFYDGQRLTFDLDGITLEELLQTSDYISIHVPKNQEYVIGKRELGLVKKGVGIINVSRGGTLDEVALVDALENGTVAFAGLDVFESEPTPEIRILMHSSISLSPHLGASTLEAQERIALELADKIIDSFKA